MFQLFLQVHSDSTNLSKGNGNQAWSCLDLLNVLCQLAESGHISSVRLMLEHPLNRCPEVLLFGIAHINVSYSVLLSVIHTHIKCPYIYLRTLYAYISMYLCTYLQTDMSLFVYSSYLIVHQKKLCFISLQTPYNLLQYEVSSTVFPVILRDPTKSGIIHRLWRVNPHMVLRGFVDTSTHPNNLFIIVDICQDLKVIS